MPTSVPEKIGAALSICVHRSLSEAKRSVLGERALQSRARKEAPLLYVEYSEA